MLVGADLRSALDIPNASLTKLFGDNIQASYVVIYVRTNPNDGQRMDGTPATYTGPVLCTNEATDNIFATTEATQIPNATNQPNAASVDILGAEESLHLQYRPNLQGGGTGPIEKRVCHTAAGNTDCFFIQPR